MFYAVCKMLYNGHGHGTTLNLLNVQVHQRQDETLFIRSCLQSEGARDKMVQVVRNTAKRDPRAHKWRVWSRAPQTFVKKVFSTVADYNYYVLSNPCHACKFTPLYFTIAIGHLAPDVELHVHVVDLILLMWADNCNCQKFTAVKMRLVDVNGKIFPSHLTKVESILQIIEEEAHLPPWIPQVIASFQEAVRCDYFNDAHTGVVHVSTVFFVADHHCLNLMMSRNDVRPWR
jgi:hypothetical protein